MTNPASIDTHELDAKVWQRIISQQRREGNFWGAVLIAVIAFAAFAGAFPWEALSIHHL